MIKMTYGQWEKLSEECQNEYIAGGMLPDVPPADLENGLISSEMIIVDGERCWEIQYSGETEKHIFPEYERETVAGITLLRKFNPMWGDYRPNQTEQPIEEEEPLGFYGEKWVDFMERCHPELVLEMQLKGSFETVARSVNETAWEYRELLDDQYMKANPRPKTFEEIVSWERTREFYTDGAVMRERVLIPRTAA